MRGKVRLTEYREVKVSGAGSSAKHPATSDNTFMFHTKVALGNFHIYA